MKEYLKQHWFEYVFAFALVLLIAIVTTVKFGYVYSTNDDVMIKSLVNGTFTGTPENHVVYVTFIAGLIWQFLYGIFPNFSWYDFTMVGLHYLCWFFLIVRVSQQSKGCIGKATAMILFTTLLCVVDFKYLIIHQYTILTSQLVAVPTFWILTAGHDEQWDEWVDRIVIISMLLIALCLRRQAFLLAIPVTCLAMLYDAWRIGNWKDKKVKGILFSAGIVVCAFLLISVVEKIAYSSPEWSAFLRSCDARTQVYDYTGVPSYDAYLQEYQELGIDEADWMAIDSYNCELAENFHVEKMEGVSNISLQEVDRWKAASNKIDLWKANLYHFTRVLFENQIQPVSVFVTALYCIAFMTCYQSKDKKTVVFIIMVMLYSLIAYSFLVGRWRFPERVVYGMLFMQLACLLAVVSKNIAYGKYEKKEKKAWRSLALGLYVGVLAVSFLYSWQIMKEERNNLQQQGEDWKYVNEYFANHADNKYCIDTNSFAFSTELMFQPTIESDNLIRTCSWVWAARFINGEWKNRAFLIC